MNVTNDHVKSIVQTAVAATVATTAATAVAGVVENGNPAAPVNAISHIVWGEKAAHRDAASTKYTWTGAALNAGAMLSWAAFHHAVFNRSRSRSVAGNLARGAATAGIAYVVDYHVVPKRLTPGFEKRLSNRSLFAIYAALAVSLAFGSQLAGGRRSPGR